MAGLEKNMHGSVCYLDTPQDAGVFSPCAATVCMKKWPPGKSKDRGSESESGIIERAIGRRCG